MRKTILIKPAKRFFVPKNRNDSENIFTYSDNYFNSVFFYINKKKVDFLIDSGASLCALQLRYLDPSIPLYREKLEIKGIGGKLVSIGYSFLNLYVEQIKFRIKCYIFESLPCRTNGIIGENFLRLYKANLDYEKNALTLLNEDKKVVLDLRATDNHVLVIPPRCEIVQYIKTGMTEECVVLPNEICLGVFVAGVIAQPKNGEVPIKILNTRESEVYLKNCLPRAERLNDYTCCQFSNQKISVSRVKKLFDLLKLNYLNEEEKVSMEGLTAKYADIFHMPGDKLSVTNIYKQSIQIKPNTQPVYVKPYRLAQTQKDEINNQVSQMLENDIIESAQSEWSSAVLLVPKKNDSTGEKRSRLVLDYRFLNRTLVDIKFPIANVVDILDSLAGALYFSHLDLSQGYYQVELDEQSRRFTAFTTDRGQWQMKRLPMGLKISPSAFSRLMTVAMAGLNYEKCFVYLDDLIVFGRNLSEHNKNLTDVFNRLRKVNLKLNPLKCEFLKKEILYLGHIISEKGISPDPDKIHALKEYPTPKNSDEVKRFVAFANYYRKFIPKFAELSVPLNKLCRKYARFEWTVECDECFQTLKNALTNYPILDYPDFSEQNEFILQTDASNFAIGAVLSNKNNKPVAYTSRSLNKAEINYPTMHKELLAIFWAVRHFRPYLYGRKFKIRTDHKPLLYLFSLADPSSRLTKFRLGLEEYDFYIEYVRGSENVTADALSRINLTSEELKSLSNNIVTVMTRNQFKGLKEQEIEGDKNNPANVRPDQPNIVEILKPPKIGVELIIATQAQIISIQKYVTEHFGNFYFVKSQSSLFYYQEAGSTLARDEMLTDLIGISNKAKIKEVFILKDSTSMEFIKEIGNGIKNTVNWRGPRILVIKGVKKVIDMDEKRIILNDFHLLPTSGHAGINRMINNIKRYYFWSGLDIDVNNFVKKCDKCQKQKYSNHYIREPMVVTSTANFSFQKVYLDIVGPLPTDSDGFNYILTLQCELTKFVEAYPLKNKDSVSVARSFVENFILRYGIPQEIATDRGSEFISSTVKEICTLLNIKQINSTAYHHESIGALENSHKVLGAYLRIQTENLNDTWSTWVPYWCFSYNTTVHTETKYTPFELIFGRECKIPNNLTDIVEPIYNFESYPLELKYRLQRAHEDAKNNLIHSKLKRKEIYDKRVNPIEYRPGDMILLKNEDGNKLMTPCFLGPYIVVKEDTPNVVVLKDNKEHVVHKNRTKLYIQ